ncbi:MAG: DUF4034 domain-containing protein [Nitrospira sp.]|nr:DUF4034 domain-containing protein [Nitrospira sp.]
MPSLKHLAVCSNSAMPALGALIVIACIRLAFESPSISHAGWVMELPQQDKRVVINLLRTAQFTRLNQLYENLQQHYEQGLINDRDLVLQYQAFYDTSPENEASLNQWVEKAPKSYPARLARGLYYASVGVEYRGAKVIANTPSAKIRDLHHYLDLSNKDLVDSLPLTAKPIVSLLRLLKSSKHRDGKQVNRRWLDDSTLIDPNNYEVRREYMITLTPRWGGSHDEMWAFLKECQDQHLPIEYLKVLEARIYLDQAQEWCCERHQPEKGLVLYRKVVNLLDGINIKERLDALKGIVDNRDKSQSLVTVAPEIEAIIQISPDDSRILGYRGWVRFQQGRFQEGLKDYETAAELGDAYSQLQFGRQLYYGMPPNIAPNREQALIWVKKAVSQGNKAAKQFMAEIEK